MRAILTIARKDLRLVLRDRASLFWIAAFPVCFALSLGAMLEGSVDDWLAPSSSMVAPRRLSLCGGAWVLPRSAA